MNNAMIEARDLTFRYEGGLSDAVSNLSLRIAEGEFVAVLGRNGCGKSTLAKLMNALLLPTSGSITVDGKQAKTEDDCYDIRRSCGMVFQNPDNQIVTTIVEEDCAFGLENLGTPPAEIRRGRCVFVYALRIGSSAVGGGNKAYVTVADAQLQVVPLLVKELEGGIQSAPAPLDGHHIAQGTHPAIHCLLG